MHLAVSIDRKRARVWHMRLIDELRADGHHVSVVPLGARHDTHKRALRLRLNRLLERTLYRIQADHPSAPIAMSPAALSAIGEHPAHVDLTIDLAGSETPGPVIAPLFDGLRDEDNAAAAILDGRNPTLGIAYRGVGMAQDRVIADAAPAIYDRSVLTRALDQVTHGAIRMVRRAVKHLALGLPIADVAQRDRSAETMVRRRGAVGLRGLAVKIAQRARRPGGSRDHWRIGLRRTGDDAVRDRLDWPAGAYRFLPDDGRRYYADPFVFMHEGTVHVFCEEFPYATRKGIIGHFTVGDDGRISAVRRVLEQPYHLSYPNVFSAMGEIFMMPESTANRTVELFRAKRFPDVWQRERALIDNVSAADPTLVFHDGRYWIFAAIADDGGSDRDALGLFYATDLFGPWTPHPLNPVVLDARAARPGGEMFRSAGRLLRPAQDCIDGYGSGLTICEVTRLDPQGYEQRTLCRLGAQASWRGAYGTHTLNQAAGIEAIDCLGSRRQFPGEALVRS